MDFKKTYVNIYLFIGENWFYLVVFPNKLQTQSRRNQNHSKFKNEFRKVLRPPQPPLFNVKTNNYILLNLAW